LGREFFPDTID
jgi:hypothetical protein